MRCSAAIICLTLKRWLASFTDASYLEVAARVRFDDPHSYGCLCVFRHDCCSEALLGIGLVSLNAHRNFIA